MSVAMLKSPLVAGKCPRSLAGIDVSSGAVTSLVSGVAHSERLTVGDDDTGVMQEPVQDAGGGGVLGAAKRRNRSLVAVSSSRGNPILSIFADIGIDRRTGVSAVTQRGRF